MRCTRLGLRTSRKGPGGWSAPTLKTSGPTLDAALVGNRASRPTPLPGAASSSTASRASTASEAAFRRSSARRSGSDGSPRSGTATGSHASAPAFGATFYDGADNAAHHAPSGAGLDAASYSWKAEAWRDRPPAGIDSNMTSLRSESGGTMRRDAKRVESARPPLGDAAGTGGTEQSTAGGGANWLGGDRKGSGATPDTLERATMRHAFGAGEFSMVDRQGVTVTRLLRLMTEATLKPRDADSRAFGGDGATKLAEQREELKILDQRFVPYQHPELMDDYLKNADRLHSPSGAVCERDMLRGRIVSLLFFTESERSMAFMRHLQVVHKRHSPDLVVVAVSLASKEMMDVTRSFGFFHVAHRDGATWVSRDAGVTIRPFMPMPRLVVVNGTTGHEITRSGVTAVLANPDTCFAAWRRGEGGYSFMDYWAATKI